ncbi:MAG: sulfotransferase [Gammaproteobacteria bacterium]|nr:sulfotransferase [Gammaproteobacteria bacterium]NNF60668.1 sulfotransferase [Gammaproteobacteria bacterium]
MLRLFGQSLWRFTQLCVQGLWPAGQRSTGRSVRRFLVMLLFLPLFGLLQLTHWVGFLLDEILFRGYRDVVIRDPVFVTGVPRSGTTLVHRTLACDTQFTTFTTWECLFAPSITQRRIVQGAARLDRAVGSPLRRLLGWAERKLFAVLEDVHGTGLSDAEEDYFVFMPVLCCFILVVPFPAAPWLWQMGQFDERMSPKQRQQLMQFYRGCIQRHLYANGAEKRFLSKNASFPPLLGSLASEFPDARFICCLRDPLEVVASQLSSLREGMEFFGNDPYDVVFRDRMINLLEYYYRNLARAPVPDLQREWVTMRQFQTELEASVEAIYTSLDIELNDQFRGQLEQMGSSARQYTSGHRYNLGEFGLDAKTLRERFEHSTAGLDYERANSETFS